METVVAPSPDQLREKAAEIIARPDYHLDFGRSDQTWRLELLLEILRWILAPLRWIYDLTEGLPDFLRTIIVLTLGLVLVLLLAHIFYSFYTAIRGDKKLIDPGLAVRRKGIEPDKYERMAREAGLRGDYITAIRFLFKASVLRLERTEKFTNRPGITNRELLYRYRDRPKLSDLLKQFVDTIDRKWYGGESCSSVDYSACEVAHREICLVIRESGHALGA